MRKVRGGKKERRKERIGEQVEGRAGGGPRLITRPGGWDQPTPLINKGRLKP